MNNKNSTVLIVDDSQINRTILSGILINEYKIIEASDGQDALDILNSQKDDIDLVLLDLVMPKIDGMFVLEVMSKNNWIEDVPVIMISSENTSTYISKAYSLGATDYIARPYDSDIVKKRIDNTIELYTKKRKLQEEINRQLNEREKENKIMISILSHIVEFRNGESGAHVLHINKITNLIFKTLFTLTNEYDSYKNDLNLICTASSLHDIGKTGIAEEILNKPGKLTDEEFAIMKTHTTIGCQMIDNISSEYKDEKLVYYAKNICLSHHEKWDGKGYPNGLKGKEIPIYAQIVSLADCYDALTSERCYKPAYAHEETIKMIKEGQCGTFNPLLLKCLDLVNEELRNIK